jgi:hypothetical protein
MSEAFTTELRHPVAQAVGMARAEIAGLAGMPLWTMGAEEAADTLLELTRLQAQVAELTMRVLDQATGLEVGAADGATSTAAWWAHHTRTTRGEAHRTARLAAALAGYHQPVRHALATGEVLLDQAQVIVDAVAALPDDLETSISQQAEAHLMELARDHDAKALRILGRHVLEVIAPEIGEAYEARLLEKEENDARAAASFTITDDGHGRSHGRFTVPTLHGAILRKHLMALASPQRASAIRIETTQAGARLPITNQITKHRLGEAFCTYLETRPTNSIGKAGGIAATVVVTMSLESLTGGLAAASLDTGERISTSEARRLACEAGIIPAVLGGPSEVLDVGRKRRYHSEPQRIAYSLRDGGCTTTGCDRPPAMCHAHHDIPWSRGGPTDLKTGRLLCPRHHTLAHHPDYQTRHLPGGKVQFTRRT